MSGAELQKLLEQEASQLGSFGEAAHADAAGRPFPGFPGKGEGALRPAAAEAAGITDWPGDQSRAEDRSP